MKDRPEDAHAASGAAAMGQASERAAQMLSMAEGSRLAVLPPGDPAAASPPQAPAGFDGVDTLLLQPLSFLPPHVTPAAAVNSHPPAVHGVDRPGAAE